MKRTTEMLKSGFVAILVVAAGCAAPHKSDSAAPPADSAALQGSWKGQEIEGNSERTVSLVLSGANLEFHGADANDWCKGTFSLREDTNPKQMIGVITEGPDPRYVGKTVYAIYRIEDGVLTISGNAPGSPAPPAAFDAPDARQLVFKIEKP
jgi:uncharacterized protein (TIGR03067 family)